MPTVLVIDDDKVNCTLIQHVVKRTGLETIVANDGNTALNLLLQADLAIIDVFLPQNKGMGGLEIVRYIKTDAKLKLIPVIVLTAAPNTNIEHEARQSGCDAFLTKPFDPESLSHIILNLINAQHS